MAGQYNGPDAPTETTATSTNSPCLLPPYPHQSRDGSRLGRGKFRRDGSCGVGAKGLGRIQPQGTICANAKNVKRPQGRAGQMELFDQAVQASLRLDDTGEDRTGLVRVQRTLELYGAPRSAPNLDPKQRGIGNGAQKRKPADHASSKAVRDSTARPSTCDSHLKMLPAHE